MITGLRVGFTGEEICAALDGRIEDCRRRAARWKYEAERPLESQTIDEPILPTHICMNEERLATWKAAVLTLIRDRIERSEVYLLEKRELASAGLLPPRPALVDAYDLDDGMTNGFSLERVDTGSAGPEIVCIRRHETGADRP
jgi:hypothetical protein